MNFETAKFYNEQDSDLILEAIYNAEEGKEEEVLNNRRNEIDFFNGDYVEEEEIIVVDEKKEKYIALCIKLYNEALATLKKWEAKQYKKAYGSVIVGCQEYGSRMDIDYINNNNKRRVIENAIRDMKMYKKDLRSEGYDVSTLAV